MTPTFSPFSYLIASRAALFVYAAIISRLVPTPGGPGLWDALPNQSWLNAWARWDSGWYLSVAERGYYFVPNGQDNVAFFPLYPLLIRAANLLGINAAVAGWLIANLSFLAAGLLFWKLTEARLGPERANRGLQWLIVFPYAFFLSAVYSESLFLLGAVGSFWAAERGRFHLAAILGAVAALTRPVGFILFPALLILGRQSSRRLRDLLPLLVIPAMPGVFLGYLWWTFGSPWVFFDSHTTGWDVRARLPLAGPISTLADAAAQGFTLKARSAFAMLNLGAKLAFLAITWLIFRHLGAPYGIYAALVLVVTVIFIEDSIGRQLLIIFPAFMVAGVLDRGGVLSDGLKLLSFTLQLLSLALFASWRWVS